MAAAKQNQKVYVEMDSRKFLSSLRSSAQAKLHLMEQKIASAGKTVNANWSLTALRGDHVIIEDTDSHTFFRADYKSSEGHVVIENIVPIRIVEHKKKQLFESACLELVNGLASGDRKAVNAAFGKLQAQKFSARTIPESGVVEINGENRRVTVADSEMAEDNIKERLVNAIVESISDKVDVNDGTITSISFGPKHKLQISEWVCRKAQARTLREAAINAWKAQGFQERIYTVAKLITDDKINDAVKFIKSFLNEYQEFTALNTAETKTLIENTLAAKGVFVQRLCENVAKLFHRTNLAVNRRTIIEEWRKAAKIAGHEALLENVQILEESQDFPVAHEQFINAIFHEAIGPRDVQVDAYRTTLGVLRNTPEIKNSGELQGKIDELMERLSSPEPDSAVIAEVEDLLAEVKNETNALATLNDFDQSGFDGFDKPGAAATPPGAGGGAATPPPPAPATPPPPAPAKPQGGGAGGVVLNININGNGVSTDQGDESLGDSDIGGDDELDKLLDNKMAKNKAGGPPGQANDVLPIENGGANAIDQVGNQFESIIDDEYPLTEAEASILVNAPISADYGTRPIAVYEDAIRAARFMLEEVISRDLDPDTMIAEMDSLVQHGIDKAGLLIPKGKLDAAYEQLVDVFTDEYRRSNRLTEDQLKFIWSYKGGRRRSRVNKPKKSAEGSAVTSESDDLKWVGQNQTGYVGKYRGVKFIFDESNHTLVSEDQAIEVPIPDEIIDSTRGSIGLVEESSEPFKSWLDVNIEQFREVSEEHQEALEEAMAIVTANQDGTISVQVDGDVDVQDAGCAPGDEECEMNDIGMPDTEVEVDDTDFDDLGGDETDETGETEIEIPTGDADEGGEESEEAEENFESDDDGDEEADEEDEEMPFEEDHDITKPGKKGYSALASEDPRKVSDADLPGDADDVLDGFNGGKTGTSELGQDGLKKIKGRTNKNKGK